VDAEDAPAANAAAEPAPAAAAEKNAPKELSGDEITQINLQLHKIRQLDQQLGADLRSHVGEGLVDEGPHARGGLGVGGIA